MITLCGFALSNYYNKVKLVLLEKGINFEEEYAHPRDMSQAARAASPLGKVPFIRTSQGSLCESQVIVEYLEALQPTPALLPADPFEAAKVLELQTFIDLHLELTARELYGLAFFGGTLSEAHQARVREKLVRHIAGFKALARFAPYVAGPQFTLADCSAWVNLPVLAMATKKVYGEDLLVADGVEWKAYAELVGQRPSAQRVTADRKAAQAAAAAG